MISVNMNFILTHFLFQAMEAMNATEHAGRTIAVDWSIPKLQYREVEEKELAAAKAAAPESEDTEMKEASDEEESSGSDDDEESNEDSDNSEDDIENNDDSENENDSEDEDDEGNEDVEAKKAKKMTGPTSADGTTLFIRNLLFESTEEDLKQL